MPAPRNRCQDTSRSSSPWRGTRRSPVICSFPSLYQVPTFIPNLPCRNCCTVGLLPASFCCAAALRNCPAKSRLESAPDDRTPKNALPRQDATTECPWIANRRVATGGPALHLSNVILARKGANMTCQLQLEQSRKNLRRSELRLAQ